MHGSQPSLQMLAHVQHHLQEAACCSTVKTPLNPFLKEACFSISLPSIEGSSTNALFFLFQSSL